MLKLNAPAGPMLPKPPEEPHIVSGTPSSSLLVTSRATLEDAKRDTREFIVDRDALTRHTGFTLFASPVLCKGDFHFSRRNGRTRHLYNPWPI